MLAAKSYLVLAAPYLALAALILALAGVGIAWWAHRRVSKLYLEAGASLEATILDLMARMKDVEQFRAGLEEYLKTAELRIHSSVRGMGMMRFNPFYGDGSGGNQSFSVAMLDERGNGVVISALHSRAGSASVYAKPVTKGTSTFELTEEEREAIKKAMESLKINPKS